MARKLKQHAIFGNQTGFGSTGPATQAEVAWSKARARPWRWAFGGILFGAAVSLIAFAPARWLASAVSSATDGRLLLAEARGSIWSGDATLALTGGVGSKDGVSLPGRLKWSVGLRGMALAARIEQECCLSEPLTLLLRPGINRVDGELLPMKGSAANWPAAALSGLGTPWNTLRMGGSLLLSSPGASFTWADGRMSMQGGARFELRNATSATTTLPDMGSYTLTLRGESSGTSVELATTQGPLFLTGSGLVSGSGLRFRGEAKAAPEATEALNNLLNIIGRRNGAVSSISIG